MAEEQSDLFKKIGIDIEKDKIDIDLGKTKTFFKSLQNMLQQKAEAVQKDLSEGKIDLGDKVGIKVDDEHIDIDLKKTKSFIEEFGQKIEHFLGEIDHVAKKLEKKPEEKS